MKQTSLDAYQMVVPHLGNLHQEVLNLIRENPSSTRRELQEKTDMEWSTMTARIKELLDKGYVEENGEREGGYILFPSQNYKDPNWKPNVETKKQKLQRWADNYFEVLKLAYKNGLEPLQGHLDVLNEMHRPLGRKEYVVVEEEVNGLVKRKITQKNEN